MFFDAFWKETGEKSFETLIRPDGECYRLLVRTGPNAQHRVFRLIRPSVHSSADSEFVAHFFVFADDLKNASARTYEFPLENHHWHGLHAAFAVAALWQLPARFDRVGFDGAFYTIEAYCPGHRRTIERWSPNPVMFGGELFCVVTDYLERLGQLAEYRCDRDLRERYGCAPRGGQRAPRLPGIACVAAVLASDPKAAAGRRRGPPSRPWTASSPGSG